MDTDGRDELERHAEMLLAELRLCLAESAALTSKLARISAMAHHVTRGLLAMAEDAPEIRTDTDDE